MSGFCGSCKIACHGDHLDQVVDLYSKRAFRCDCGNSRMCNRCVLDPEKQIVNNDNMHIYSHNFVGLYCFCNRGFDPKLGDMFQCVICEDWFHLPCLSIPGLSKRKVPRSLRNILYELTCRNCVGILPVLKKYYVAMGLFKPKDLTSQSVPTAVRSQGCTIPITACEGLPENVDFVWQPGFRESLCTCRNCLALYSRARVSFVVDHREFASGGTSALQDHELLDGIADAQIIGEILADEQPSKNDSEADVVGSQKNTFLTLDDSDSGSKGTQSSNDDAVSDDAVESEFWLSPGAASVDEEQHAIQSRIRTFLQETIQTNGKSMTHAALLAYLADLKAEYIRNVRNLQNDPSSSHRSAS